MTSSPSTHRQGPKAGKRSADGGPEMTRELNQAVVNRAKELGA